jgi:hypothetical protein
MPNYTNLAANSEFTGAAVGTIGSGGAAPTGFGYPTSGGGLTITNEVLSLSTTAGMTTMRWKSTLTNATGGDHYGGLSLGYSEGLASSTLHQLGVWTQLIALTGSTYFFWLGVNQFNNGWGFVTQNNNLGNPGGGLTRLTNSFTTDATATKAEIYLGWGVVNGGSFSVTVDVAQPMLVQGSYLPSYIPAGQARAQWPFRGHNRTYLEM